VTQQEFETLVTRLEKTAAERMGFYRMKVILLSAAGYLYIVFIMLMILAAAAVLLGILSKLRASGAAMKLLIALGALALAVFRSLIVRWPEPEGILIRRDQAPKLFSEVDAIRKKLRAPKVHRIFIDGNYNASMEQRPRLGILGWREGQMHVGLPLMHALSPAAFRAVLAHELGHLSGNHGRIAGWIYRIRQTWLQLLQRLESEGRPGAILFTTFFSWYAPFLNAYSFVLARAHEYEADRCAAEIAGSKTTATALVAVDVRGRFLSEEFWPTLWKTADTSDRPPASPYLQQRSSLLSTLPRERTDVWVRQALTVKTGYVDTHPSLNDRIKALGVNIPASEWLPEVNQLAGPSAAEEYLGPTLDHWYRVLEERWTEAAQSSWKARHSQIQEYRRRLLELRDRKKETPLTEGESWELTELVRDLEGDEAVVTILEELIAANSTHVSANFELGRILLGRGNSLGLAHLENSMKTNSDCTFAACALAEQFLREQNRPGEADEYHRRAVEFSDVNVEAERERSRITAADTFVEAKVDPAILQETRKHLQVHIRLKAAFFVQKSVRLRPEKPAYVLGILPDRPWYNPPIRKKT